MQMKGPIQPHTYTRICIDLDLYECTIQSHSLILVIKVFVMLYIVLVNSYLIYIWEWLKEQT